MALGTKRGTNDKNKVSNSTDDDDEIINVKKKFSELSPDERLKISKRGNFRGARLAGMKIPSIEPIEKLVEKYFPNFTSLTDYHMVMTKYPETNTTDGQYYINFDGAEYSIIINHNFTSAEDCKKLIELVCNVKKMTIDYYGYIHLTQIVGDLAITKEYQDFIAFPEGFPKHLDGNFVFNPILKNPMFEEGQNVFEYAPKHIKGSVSINSMVESEAKPETGQRLDKRNLVVWHKQVSDYISLLKKCNQSIEFVCNKDLCKMISSIQP